MLSGFILPESYFQKNDIFQRFTSYRSKYPMIYKGNNSSFRGVKSHIRIPFLSNKTVRKIRLKRYAFDNKKLAKAF
jgi:hypothetical protein